MKHKALISIIVPTYNERKNIISLIESISKILNKHQIAFEVIVVDDNSPDNTYDHIKDMYQNDKRIRPYKRNTNRGLASAIVFGILKAKGSILIGMDADFNHPPSLLPKLIDALAYSHIAIASRFVKGGSMEEPVRFYATFIFNLFLKNILGFPVLDNLSGYYAIKRNDIKKLPLRHIYRGYGEYHLRLLKCIQNKGLKIVEIPVKYGKRKYGQSKSSLIKLFFTYLQVAFELSI